ncbi:MAG: glycosyltransferase family 2 protein [Elusimicrobia bacterium]|nr:glycosyltransferase family 2 protein [Elusimicrobiota bacterium]
MLNIVVSLTTYPARISTVNQAIETLLNQSVKADKVILWLGLEQFPNKEKDLPENLLALKNNGLTIDWCRDIKPYKKLIPALQKYPDKIIVTADDDVLYPSDWLEKLYKAYKDNPTYIHCHRAHRILFKFGRKKLVPYRKWLRCIKDVKPSFCNFFTGMGGVLYPPNCLHKDILREDLFMKLCPKNDDIWFWAMGVLNNREINIVKDNILDFDYIEDSQQTSLYEFNYYNNDASINEVLSNYPQLIKSLFNIKNKRENIEFFLKTKIKKYI